jgi:acetoacetyl-CoA synthetase
MARSIERTSRLEMRRIISTGLPLVAKLRLYVFKSEGRRLPGVDRAAPTSAAFADGNPVLPVHAAKVPLARHGGRGVQRRGRAHRRPEGELVCTKPIPSSRWVWNDKGGEKYPAPITRNSPASGLATGDSRARTMIVYGRSDATLNPGACGIGTAEIYRQVEKSTKWKSPWRSPVLPPDKPTDTRVVLSCVCGPDFAR